MKKINKKPSKDKKNESTPLSVESLKFEDYLKFELEGAGSKKKQKKVILTITIDEESCRKLKRLIPEGEVSKFTSKIIREGIKRIEEKIFREYDKIGRDQELNEQIKKLSIS